MQITRRNKIPDPPPPVELSPIEHARKHFPQFTEAELQAALRIGVPAEVNAAKERLAVLAAQLKARVVPVGRRLARR